MVSSPNLILQVSIVFMSFFLHSKPHACWSLWPRGLSRRSVAVWFLGSRVRIPLRACMFVSSVYVLCCPVYVEAFETGWSLVQRSPTACLNTKIKKPQRRGGQRPIWSVAPWNGNRMPSFPWLHQLCLLPTYPNTLLSKAEWWRYCIHLRNLNVRNFGVVGDTRLKIYSRGHLQWHHLSTKFHKNPLIG
jgi:hypothetical protein